MLKEAPAGRVVQAEMEAHLQQTEGRQGGNHRNGSSSKKVLTDNRQIDLAVPRDRHRPFQPQLVEEYARCLPGFDEKVISMSARGLSRRQIQELCSVKVFRELIGTPTRCTSRSGNSSRVR